MVNNRWAQLSQAEKAELLGIYTSRGYTDLAKIVADYNSYASGGYVSNSATYKSDAYLYNPPVDEGAPITVPLKYEPLPHYGDYEYPTSTGMVDSMPIPTPSFDIVDNYVNVPTDREIIASSSRLDPIADAAARIRAVENSKDNKEGGWDPKTKRWYPHRSHEGGADTIAYGIKLSNGTPEAALALKQGYLTDEQAESALDSLARKYYDSAKKVYDNRYGEGEWDKLSDKSQSILVDYSYNPGLAKFPNLMEGFHSGNIDMIRDNYKRYSNGKPLGRNKTLLEEIDTLGNQYPIFRANGGSIHIKLENRGKFTALKKRTGHSASWFKEHGTPAQKKMAIFALNARKWKHADGGPIANYLDSDGTYSVIPLGDDYLSYLQSIPEVSGGTIEPAVVTAALPAKFNGSQEAARRYAEGYLWGKKNVRDSREKVAPYVGAGLALTAAAPFLIDAGAAIAASELGAYGNIYANAAKRFVRDIPAFELFDRAPTIFGDQRFTEYVKDKTTDVLQKAFPNNRVVSDVAPYVGEVVGPLIGGIAPGIAGDIAMRGLTSATNSAIDYFGRNVVNRFKFSESDWKNIINSINESIPNKEQSISRAFFDKDRYRSIVKQLTDYRQANDSYNLSHEQVYDYFKPWKISKNENIAIRALENDLDDQSLVSGFKYDDIGNPTKYKGTPDSFFDAALDRGFDTRPLLDRYQQYADFLTQPTGYRPYPWDPSSLLDEMRFGKFNLDDYKRIIPDTIVNEDGSINSSELTKAYREVLKELKAQGIEPVSINRQYGSSRNVTTLKKHVEGVVKTAQEIPVPKGSSRAELVRAALVHDIGKLYTGQEAASAYSEHPIVGERWLRTLPQLQEFSTPEIRSAVLMHMDDSVTPIYGSHGRGTLDDSHPFRSVLDRSSSQMDQPENIGINYDLLHALQASDVARGLSYDQAAIRFPQLFTYDKENPVKVQLYDGTPEEQLKNVINPLLKRQGYPTVKTSDALEETMRRHRSFLRGVRDPYKTAPDADIDGSVLGLDSYYPSGTLADKRNAIGAAESALEHYGENTELARLLISEGVIPKYPTGFGRASLFGIKNGRFGYTTDKGVGVLGEVYDNDIGALSSRLKISPDQQDALYLSASPQLMREYSNSWTNPRGGMDAMVTIPNEPIGAAETFPEFYERSNFQLYAGDAPGAKGDIVSSSQPMSNFQMFEEPYRLQTGRSLQQDMTKEFEGKKLQKHSNSGFIEDEGLVEMMQNNRSRLVSIGEKFGIDFSKMYPEIQSPSGAKGVLGNMKAAGELDHVASLYESDGGTGLGLNTTGAEFLFKKGFISDKTFRTFKTLNKECFHAMENARHSTFLDAPEAEAAANKAKAKLSKFVNTYILNKNNLYKAKQAYFKEAKPDFKMSKEFAKYMHDPENIVRFMREKGVAPLYEMPSFGKTEIFSTNSQGWGWGPKTRSFAPSTNASQGIIIGKRGQKLLDVKPFTEEEKQDLFRPLGKYKGKYRSGSRDAGSRYTGEDKRFAITRKTFDNGGILCNISDIF